MNRRSQLTTFMLLGIVVLFVFIFLFWATQIYGPAELQKQADLVINEVLKTGALEYYVNLCLREAVYDAVEVVGQQGGNLYLNQGGTVELNSVDYINYNNYSVSYGLREMSLLGQPGFPFPPGYPFGYRKSLFYDSGESLPWFYGERLLPFLCQPGGPNDINQSRYVPWPCNGPHYGPNSIQEQLALYTERRLPKCVNLSFFKHISGYEVVAGSPDVDIILAENDLAVNATYPLSITIEEEKVVRTMDFRTNVPVRLKKVYSVLFFLLKNEITLIDFEIDKDYHLSPDWDPHIKVTRFCPYCSSGGDYTDIIKITDAGSKVRGKDFVFVTAIENRNPALDYIHRTGNEPVLPTFESRYNLTIDIIAQENDTIVLTPKGYDPDNDNLTYLYSGWKETKDADFDFDCCCQFTDHTLCPMGKHICAENPLICVVEKPTVLPRNWSGSLEFQTTGQNATYTTNHSDAGLHDVTIVTSDDEGQKDWQKVWILIIPKLVLSPGGFSGYPDIPADAGSIEDPYTFIVDISGLLYVVDDYYWWDSSHSDIDVHTTIAPFNVPIDSPFGPDDGDIENIKDFGFKTDPGSTSENHTVNVTVESGGGNSTSGFDVRVHQCLPHRNPLNNAPPYPYHNLGIAGIDTISNPYMASHICCENATGITWGSYNTGDNCFNYTRYGSWASFDTEIFKDLMNDGSYTGIDWVDISASAFDPPYNNSVSIKDDAANDILIRTFERECSHDRGNVCSGPLVDKIESHVDCEDDSDVPEDSPDGRCKGPSLYFLQAGTADTIAPVCENYTDTTFEYEIFGDPFTPFCNDALAASPGEGGLYGSGGNFMCYATCDSNGECKKAINCTCAAGNECDGQLYIDLFPSGMCMESVTGARGRCMNDCTFYEYDMKKEACDCVLSAGYDDMAPPWVWEMSGGLPIANPACCGDDPGEYDTSNYLGDQVCCHSITTEYDCINPYNNDCMDSRTVFNEYHCFNGTITVCGTDVDLCAIEPSTNPNFVYVCDIATSFNWDYIAKPIPLPWGPTLVDCAGDCGYCNFDLGVCAPKHSACPGDCGYCTPGFTCAGNVSICENSYSCADCVSDGATPPSYDCTAEPSLCTSGGCTMCSAGMNCVADSGQCTAPEICQYVNWRYFQCYDPTPPP